MGPSLLYQEWEKIIFSISSHLRNNFDLKIQLIKLTGILGTQIQISYR